MLERVKREIEQSVSPALSGLAVDAQDLLASELQLFKQEARNEATKALRVAAGFLAAGLTALLMVAFFAIGAIQLLTETYPGMRPSVATAIVALALGVLTIVQAAYWKHISGNDDTSALASMPVRAKATLEPRVRQLSHAVERTIDAAETAVEEVTQNVKAAVDPREHVQKRPFTTIGASIATGFIAGRMFFPKDGSSDARESVRPGQFAAHRELYSKLNGSGLSQNKESRVPRTAEDADQESSGIKSLLAGIAAAVVKDAIEDTLPRTLKSIAGSSAGPESPIVSLVKSLFGERRTAPVPHREPARDEITAVGANRVQASDEYVLGSPELSSDARKPPPSDSAVHRDDGWEDSLPH